VYNITSSWIEVLCTSFVAATLSIIYIHIIIYIYIYNYVWRKASIYIKGNFGGLLLHMTVNITVV